METKVKRVQVQIYNFPSGLVTAINGQPDWELVTTYKDPYPDGQTNYEIRYQGRRVIGFSCWHGYGFGASAVYPTMDFSDYELLKSVYPNSCNVWKIVQ